MVSDEQFLVWIYIAFVSLFGMGCFLLFPRKKSSRTSVFIVMGLLLYCAVIFGVDLHFHRSSHFELNPKTFHWIWRLGVLQDPLGLCYALLVSLLSLGVAFFFYLGKEESIKKETDLAGLCFGCFGVLLSSVSATPGFVYFGLFWSVFGGFLLTRGAGTFYLLESSAGVLLLLFGGVCLFGFSPSLGWDSSLDQMSAILVLLGVFILTQSAPFGRWFYQESFLNGEPAFFPHVFSFLTGLLFLLRIETQLRGSSIFEIFSVGLLLSSVFSSLSGLFQEKQASGLALWVSGAHSLLVGGYCFFPQTVVFSVLIGCELAVISFLLFSSVKSKIGVLLSALVSMCFVGFSTLPGFWMDFLFKAALFLNFLLSWKLAREECLLKYKKTTPIKVSLKVSLKASLAVGIYCFCVLGLLWVWIGSGFSFKRFTGRFVLVLVSFLTAFLMISQKKNHWKEFCGRFSGPATFFRDGFGIVFLIKKLMRIEVVLNQGLHTLDLCDEAIKKMSIQQIQRTRHFLVSVKEKEESFLSVLEGFFLRTTSVLGKLMQVLHSGDLQWQMMFAVGVLIVFFVGFAGFFN